MRGGTPRFDRNGIRFSQGSVVSPPSRFEPGATRTLERDLNLQFVPFASLDFGFQNIPLVGTAIAAGSAWYGLKRWVIGRDVPPCFWNGWRVELSACNPVAAVDSDHSEEALNVAAFGTAEGFGAAIVMGINLTCSPGSWSAGPGDVPLVETTSGSFGSGPNERAVAHFAKGTIGDTIKPFVVRTAQTTPVNVLLTDGMKLDVALVVRRAQVDGITKSVGILSHCFGELNLSMLHSQREVPQ